MNLENQEESLYVFLALYLLLFYIIFYVFTIHFPILYKPAALIFKGD